MQNEIYKEQMVKVSDWNLNVLTYSVGRDYVCIVSNLDPSATLCRAKARTEENAVQQALEIAAERLQTHQRHEVRHILNSGAELAKIVHEDGNREFTPQEFQALDHDERAEMFLSGKLQFFDSNGHIIGSGEAVRLLLSLI
ncbi:MAG: hypothetical protein JST12_06385 [Armatimonadetes bacterium]|nr:hypothetical protein [Armatimonadota bacterium]MBS1701269.1 hypothetical protein [Armatimonadota bacterium]MBS1728484.1 hypothetical protein [Armatimonadota bacterium]